MNRNADAVVVGGGVIGLTAALALADRGLSVTVFDKGQMGREASWAGAGIIPPGPTPPYRTPLDALRSESAAAFPRLAERILRETGLDIGYRQTGGIELALNDSEATELKEAARYWTDLGIDCETLTGSELASIEPGLSPSVKQGAYLPGLAQVRNPWLLRGLEQAGAMGGVRYRPGLAVAGFVTRDDRVNAVRLSTGDEFGCGKVLVAAGPWSPLISDQLSRLPIFPVKGEILALECIPGPRHILLAGRRYVVPREGGLALVGSTELNSGFSKDVTRGGTDELRTFADSIFPAFAKAEAAAAWAGLRPGCALDSPIIGRLNPWSNVWVAAGHFRQGIQTAPGTARLVSDWMSGKPSYVDESSFLLDTDRSGFRDVFQS